MLDASERGVWSLTKLGWETKLSPTDSAALFRKVWRQWKASDRETDRAIASTETAEQTPDELAEQRSPEDVEENRSSDYQEELLALLRGLTPSGFENFCRRLLREAGYQATKVTGKPGDRGIDGTGLLELGPLVKHRIAFQCKKYSGSVSSGEVQSFRGAIEGVAEHGIIFTTGTYTAQGRQEAAKAGARLIELIDRDGLVELCEKHGLGLSKVQTYRVDRTFFEAFE